MPAAGQFLIYLTAGLCCLCAMAFARGRGSLAAALLALATFAYAFLVYRWWVPPAAAGVAAAAGYGFTRSLRERQRWLPAIGLAGAALAAFAVFGPADGLF